MITAKNISSATVVLSVENLRWTRKLMPNQASPISEEVYNELSFDVGFQNLVQSGFLKIDGANNEQVEVIEVKKTAMPVNDIKAILEARDITKFSKMIKNASEATKDSIVKYAVEMRVADSAFTALIKKYCGVDVVDAISAQAEA